MLVLFPEGCVSKRSAFEAIGRGEKKPENVYLYIGTTSLYPKLAPKGKQVIYAVVSCLPDPKLDPAPYLDYIDKGVRKLVPELYQSDCIERTELPPLVTTASLRGKAASPTALPILWGRPDRTGQKEIRLWKASTS
jgi:hypothetical protein